MPRVRCSMSLNTKNMGKKYKLTDETINFDGRTLYRIEAVRDFYDVKKGDKGGWVESERNLSQDGNCWVYDNAKVFGNAEVSEDAIVRDNAGVRGFAKVYGYARICLNARVCSRAEIYDNAIVSDAIVCGYAQVYDKAQVSDYARVSGDAEVSGEVEVWGRAHIVGGAKVKNRTDYIVFKNFWSSGRYFTWTRSNNRWIVGCFYGTGEELIKKAYADSENSGREYERVVRYVESILADEEKEDRKIESEQ